jgi:hypothetical protein
MVVLVVVDMLVEVQVVQDYLDQEAQEIRHL